MNPSEKKKITRHVYKTGAAGCGGKAAPTSAKNAGQPLPCPYCDRIFKQDGRLKEHLKNKHADDELPEVEASPSEAVLPEPGVQDIKNESLQSLNPQRDASGYPIKTPKTLLHEWCQKNKQPLPKFKPVEAEGGWHCRVILPDLKKSEADVIMWYNKTATRTSMEAQHRASVVALHHLMGNRRLDRVLGEDYKQDWLDLDAAAERQKAYLKEHPPQPKPKPAPVQRELHTVFMSEDNRRLVEDILKGSDVVDSAHSTINDMTWELEADRNEHGEGMTEDLATSSRFGKLENLSKPSGTVSQQTRQLQAVSGHNHHQRHRASQGAAKLEHREKSSHQREMLSPFTTNRVSSDASAADHLRSQLLRFGFKQQHVNAALVERKELIRALDWLVLNVPEHELPAKFAAESSKASVHVLVKGKQGPNGFSNGFADGWDESMLWLQQYGYAADDCMAALVDANGDESLALCSLFKTLIGDQAIVSTKTGASQAAQNIAEMRAEEVVALQSIFEEEGTYLTKDFMQFPITSEADVDVPLNMEVRIPAGCHYPHEVPIVAFKSKSHRPEFLLELTKEVGNFAMQLVGALMLYDLVVAGRDLAHSLLQKTSLNEDVLDYESETEIRPTDSDTGKLAGREDQSISSFSSNAEEMSPASAHPITTVNSSNTLSTAYVPPALRKMQRSGAFELNPVKGDNVRKPDIPDRDDRAQVPMLSDTASHRLHKTGRKSLQVDDTSVENGRLKEEWEAWQKSGRHSEMRGIRAKLPAYKYRGDLLKAFNSCSVTIVCGQTGCGKSTQVPQYVLEDYIEMGKGAECNIICTQPRRLSAIGLADRVSKERSQAVGETVGYSVRLDSCRSHRTRLLFCTTGILLRRLLSDPDLVGVTHVIVDEVHERTLEGDLLLLLLHQFLQRSNNTLHVILMSATVDAGLFANYFRQGLGYSPPVMTIPGFTFPVRELYLEDALELTGYKVGRNSRYAGRKKATPTEDVSQSAGLVSRGISSLMGERDDWESGLDDHDDSATAANDLYSKATQQSLSVVDESIINFELIETLICSILQLELEPSAKYGFLTASDGDAERREGKALVLSSGQAQKAGAILVFLPGMMEIRRLQSRLQSSSQIAACGLGGLWVLALHGSLSGEEQKRVFLKPPSGVRKIVLATNIAETSITIDDVVYVIDSGRHKEMRYDHNRGLSCLEDTWISKANARQRRGRAGRVRPGCCLRLFSRQQFQKLDEQQLPEMLRVSLEGLCLRVKSLLPGKVETVVSQMLTPPSIDAVRIALKSLEDLNALDKAETLTPLGLHLARMPVDAQVGKLLIFACMLKCLDPILTIAASLSARSPFVSPIERREEAAGAWLKFAGNSKSDHMAVVVAYNGWLNARQGGWDAESNYLSGNFLSREVLAGIEASRSDYLQILADLGFMPGFEDREHGKGQSAEDSLSTNANSVRVVKALICAGFYPNIVRVHHPEKTFVQTEGGTVQKTAAAHELRFFTKEDGRVFLHPASVNFPVGHFESPYLVFTEKVKTSKVFLRQSTMVPAYALLLFGGEIRVKHERQAITVDTWLQFEAPARIAVLIRELRMKVDSLLLQKIQQPSVNISSSPVIEVLIRLLTTDGF